MELADLISYLHRTGWTESPQFVNHYVKNGTKGIVAIDSGSNAAYIVETVGSVPWSRITNIGQFELDLAHLQ